MAIIALAVSLTAPFWEEAVLGSINIHLPTSRELQRTAAALDLLDRRAADIEKQLSATTAQLVRLQSGAAQTAIRADAAAAFVGIVAMADLAVALRRGGGFDLELAAVRATTPNQGELQALLDTIRPYAVTGVPTTAQLRDELSRSRRGASTATWIGQLLPWSRETGTGPQLLAQASTQINSGDVAGAVETLRQVAASQQELLADWMEDASARVAADLVVQRFTDLVAQRAGSAAAPLKP